jgi:Tol biopolymer transport system component
MLSNLLKKFGNKQPHSRIIFERTGDTVPGCPRGIYTINPDRSDIRQVRSSGQSPRWSPDGQWISFMEGTKDNGWLASVFVVKPDGQKVRRLTFHDDVDATPASWSPNSKQLTYSLWLWQEKTYQLCVVDIGTTQWRHILYTEDAIYPTWSPYNTIVFNQYGSSGGPRLYEVDPDGQNLQPCKLFEPGDSEPAWTPDARKVAFIRDGEIKVMNSDGTSPEQVDSRGAIQLAISPDGQKLAYSSSRESKNSGFEVFVVTLADKSKVRLVANPIIGDKEVDSRVVSWSPWL